MPPLHLSLFPPSLALTLSSARIRALRRRYEGLTGFDERNPVAVARALSFRPLPERTSAFLHGVAYLATDDGREAVYEAARRRRDLGRWSRMPALDVAIEVERAADAGDPVAIQIRKRARIRRGRFLVSTAEYELLLKLRARPTSLETLVEAGRVVHGGDVIDAWVVDCMDGVLRAVVVHVGLAVSMTVVDRGAIVRRPRRPLACDVIRWDAARGRVGFALARPAMLARWRGAVEAQCAGAVFERRPSLTLKPAHREGIGWFVKGRLPRGAKHADVVACEVDDGLRFSARGENAIGEVQTRLGISGYMWRSTVRWFTARGPADATVELPNKLIIPDLAHDALIREGLDAAELTLPGKIPDDVPSLAPRDQPEWRWIEVVSREAFAWLVSVSVLKESRSNRPADERFRAHGSMFTAHEIEGEDTLYCCPADFSEEARDEPAGVLKRWKLDVKALADVVREKMEVAPARAERIGDVGEGVIALGELVTKRGDAVLFLVLRAVRKEDAAALAKKMREACFKAQHPVAIVAHGRGSGVATAFVEVSDAELLGFGDLIGLAARAADTVKLGDDVEPWRWATRERPLVIACAAEEIWLGRVRLDLTENQEKLLTRLANAEAGFLSASELGASISPKAALPDQIVRKAMLDLEARVRASAKKQRIALPEEWVTGLVEEKRGKGYRLGVGAVVR